MATWDNLPIMIALPLAVIAALMSGNAQARRAVSVFITQALEARPGDPGGDPGYLPGTAPEPDRVLSSPQTEAPQLFLQ